MTNELFLNATGEVMKTIAGDEYNCVTFTVHETFFSVNLHANGSCTQGIGETLPEALQRAREEASA